MGSKIARAVIRSYALVRPSPSLLDLVAHAITDRREWSLSVGSTALGSCSVSRAHVLCLIPAHKDVSLLGHASAR